MEAKGRPLRVLIIEDSEDDFELIVAVLTNAGFGVQASRVQNARQLRSVLGSRQWDFAICDQEMPAFDAASALSIVKQADLDIPFVIVSGALPEAVGIAAMRDGAADFVDKSSLQRLIPIIERELRGADIRANLKAIEAEVQWMNRHDAMTGLFNRQHFLERLESFVATRTKGAVILLELNRFGELNKTLGLSVASWLLAGFADRLKQFVSCGSVLARISDNKFGAICPNLSFEEGTEKFQAAVKEALNQPIVIDQHEVFVTCNAGVAHCPRDGTEAQELIRRAEVALDTAQRMGPGICRTYDASMSRSGERRLMMEHALHRAFRDQEFLLHYQPQVELSTGHIVGAEALVRWRDPQRGMVSPLEFIPLLEETGLIVSVGEWILRKACFAARGWQAQGLQLGRIAVNLSPTQIRHPNFTDVVEDILLETGLDPNCLELELTEHVALQNEQEIIDSLHQIRRLGVRLAIDDFGTGYSAFSYLRRFPVDVLKIDRSFVCDVLGNSRERAIVKAMVEMAHSLKLRVVAEGVEREEESLFLQRHGCDEAQGYHFSRPIPEEEFVEYLRSAPGTRL